MSQTVKQHWRNVFSPFLAWKEAEILMAGMLLIQRKTAFLYFSFPSHFWQGILHEWSRLRYCYEELQKASTFRQVRNKQFGEKSWEHSSHCGESLSDPSLGDIKERSCLMMPSFHFLLLLLLTHFHHLLPCRCQSCCQFSLASCVHMVCAAEQFLAELAVP